MKTSLLKVVNCFIALTGCIALLGYASPTYAADTPAANILVAGTLSNQVQPRQTLVPPLPGAAQYQERPLPITYPDSGNGPMPNIGYWLPTGTIHQGGYLRIRGSNLLPGNTFAYVGSVKLLPGQIQTASEISFIIPDNLLTPEGKPLVAYLKGGQVRTLEDSYKVYPRVAVTSVAPTTLKQGTRVTIKGTSLFLADLQSKYSPAKLMNGQTVYDSSMINGNFVIIDFNNQSVYAKSVLITNPVFSANGDTFEFTVGALYENVPVNYCGGSAGCYNVTKLSPMSPLPASLKGTLQLRTCGGTYVLGPSVTWMP